MSRLVRDPADYNPGNNQYKISQKERDQQLLHGKQEQELESIFRLSDQVDKNKL